MSLSNLTLKDFFNNVIKYLEHSGLSTKTTHVIDTAVDDFNALDVFDRHDVFYRSRFIISKLRHTGLQGCRCPRCSLQKV